MTQSRLQTLSRDLASYVAQVRDPRELMTAALNLALHANHIVEGAAKRGYLLLVARKTAEEDVVRSLRQQIAAHDDEYFALAEVDDNAATQHFRTARLLSAVAMALDEAAPDEVIYEAAHSLDDPEAMVRLLLPSS